MFSIIFSPGYDAVSKSKMLAAVVSDASVLRQQYDMANTPRRIWCLEILLTVFVTERGKSRRLQAIVYWQLAVI
jgi:hypothetical protein